MATWKWGQCAQSLSENIREEPFWCCYWKMWFTDAWKVSHVSHTSPDSLVTYLCHESSLLEIKCPVKHKDNFSISDCIDTDKEFCLDKNFLLKSSHKYYGQVKMQMYIYGLKACYFVIWIPMFCADVLGPYDDSFTKNVPVIPEFHKKHVTRELITTAIENTQYQDHGEEDVELFCYCQTPYDDSKPYVGCNDAHCNYRWIHFTCAKVKKQGKVSHGTESFEKEKIIAKLI